MFTLLRIRFYPFSFRSVLPVHIAPGTFEYAMKFEVLAWGLIRGGLIRGGLIRGGANSRIYGKFSLVDKAHCCISDLMF